MEEETKKGSGLFKMLGIAAVLGALIALGRVVFKVFLGKSGANDSPEGV
jgi:hypothetical protein